MHAHLLGERRSPELSNLLHIEHAAHDFRGIILPCFLTRFAAPDDAWGIAREAGGGAHICPASRASTAIGVLGAARTLCPHLRRKAKLVGKRPARGFGIVVVPGWSV